MGTFIRSLFIVLALSVLLPVWSFAEVKIGDSAPDFTLIDSNEQQRSLSEFAGQYIVLEWFNPECPFVKKHYDSGNMQGLQEKYTSQDVVWLSIDSSADGNQGYLLPKEAQQFIQEKNVHSTVVLLDPKGNVGKLYGAQTTPHMFIIDPQGKLIYQGAIDDVSSTDSDDIPDARNYVDETLTLALSGKPVTGFATKSYGCSVKY